MATSRDDRLYEEASKRRTRATGWFSSFFCTGQPQEEAADMFDKAAEGYRSSKQFEKAADAYIQSAECRLPGDDQLMAAKAYVDAGHAYKHIPDEEKAFESFTKAVGIYKKLCKYVQAAKVCETQAGLYVKADDKQKAFDMYWEARECYVLDNFSTYSAHKAEALCAHLAGEMRDFVKAIEIFEKLADDNAKNPKPMYKFPAKEYYFKAFLCALALDPVRAKQVIDCCDFTYFKQSKEFAFCQKLLKDIESDKASEYRSHVADYLAANTAEHWVELMLTKIIQFPGEEKAVVETTNMAPIQVEDDDLT